jgi:hypothetical protein
MTSEFGFVSFDNVTKNDQGEKNNFGFVSFGDPVKEKNQEEGFWSNLARTSLQIPQGLAEGTTPGLAAGLFQLGALGESELGVEEWQNLRRLYEERGEDFDEAYERGRQEMLGMIPTVSNIAGKVEKETGLPLEPHTWYQKMLRLGSLAGKMQPGAVIQKAGAAVAAPVASQILQSAGVPEVFADPAALAVGGYAGSKTPAYDVSLTKQKPSGLPERQFENLKEKREVSPKKLTQINDKLESDFKTISDRIIKESPVGETAENLRNDPTFKQESRELLNQAQEIADTLPDKISSKSVKKEMADIGATKTKGFALSEFDKSYLKFMKEAIQDIVPENISAGELVEQYRKNNASLSEYFEPGSSKALNRAKKQALLDQNRAIATVIEKTNPELSTVFKDGNARWTKIMDAEAVDGFINEIFKEGVNYKKMREFFNKNGYDFIFKRALGEKGYADFEQLMKDMLTSETPYKMLRAAQARGMEELFKTGMGYILHPKIGYAKAAWDATRGSYKALINAMLDKPKIGITWKRAVDDLKKGNFAAAEKDFATLEREVKEVTPEVLPREAIEHKPKTEGETIEAKGEKVEPKNEKATGFKTEKGSTYTVNEDGSTTRNKAYRPEHGKEEHGLQPKSDKTWFVSKEDADKLGEFQTRGEGKRLIEFPDGRLGIMYDTGKNAGKVEARTVVTPQLEPKKGLLPVESWEGGKKVHFGNKITEIEKPPELPATPTKAKTAPVEKEAKTKKLTKEEEKHLFGSKKKPTERPIGESSTMEEHFEFERKRIENGIKSNSEKLKNAQTKLQKDIASSSLENFKKQKQTLKKRISDFEKSKSEVPAKSINEEKIKSIKRQDISKKGLKEQKNWLIENLDDAIVKALDPKEIQPPTARKGTSAFQSQLKEYRNQMKSVNEYLTFDVPGDGVFKIKNHKKALEQFRDSVDKKWPEKPLKDLYPKYKGNPANK